MGTEKPAQQVRPECSKLISIISDRRLFDNGTDELSDKQGKNKEKKKSKWLCNNLGSKTTRSQFKPTTLKGFRDLTPQNPLKFNKNEKKMNNSKVI